MNHFAICLKLSQHCKSTLLQLKEVDRQSTIDLGSSENIKKKKKESKQQKQMHKKHRVWA